MALDQSSSESKDEILSLQIRNLGLLTETRVLKAKIDELEKENGELKRLNQQQQSKWNALASMVAPLLRNDATDTVESDSNVNDSGAAAELSGNDDDSDAWSTLCVSESDFNDFAMNANSVVVAHQDQVDSHLNGQCVDNGEDIVTIMNVPASELVIGDPQVDVNHHDMESMSRAVNVTLNNAVGAVGKEGNYSSVKGEHEVALEDVSEIIGAYVDQQLIEKTTCCERVDSLIFDPINTSSAEEPLLNIVSAAEGGAKTNDMFGISVQFATLFTTQASDTVSIQSKAEVQSEQSYNGQSEVDEGNGENLEQNENELKTGPITTTIGNFGIYHAQELISNDADVDAESVDGKSHDLVDRKSADSNLDGQNQSLPPITSEAAPSTSHQPNTERPSTNKSTIQLRKRKSAGHCRFCIPSEQHLCRQNNTGARSNASPKNSSVKHEILVNGKHEPAHDEAPDHAAADQSASSATPSTKINRSNQRKREREGGPHACPVRGCDKRFWLQEYLEKHNEVHSKGRPHECSDCGKSFIQHHHLRQHMRTHSGDKPYRCDACEKFYAQNSSLNRHKRFHSGEKFKCPRRGCGSMFLQRYSLTKHRVLHNH